MTILKEINDKSHDLIEVSYDGEVLKYFKEDADFINVLIHTIPGGVWIRKADLKKYKFKAQNWLNFMLSEKDFWYDYNDVDLKKNPNSSSKTIVRIKGEKFNIIFTGKTKDVWAEVKVNEYKSEDDIYNEKRIKNKYNGWIKAIDKKGKPSVWFYTRGM